MVGDGKMKNKERELGRDYKTTKRGKVKRQQKFPQSILRLTIACFIWKLSASLLLNESFMLIEM